MGKLRSNSNERLCSKDRATMFLRKTEQSVQELREYREATRPKDCGAIVFPEKTEQLVSELWEYSEAT